MAECTTLLLARHGQIQANVEQRWHGSTDSELTATGHEQARRLAAYLAREEQRIDAIYTSPLSRARQTAAPIGAAFGITPVVMNDLQEFGIGVLENRGYRELLENERFYERIGENNDYAPEGGESVTAVARRMRRALDAITRAHVGQSVLLVGHGAAIAILLAALLDGQCFPFDQYHHSNTGVTQLLCGDGFELGFFDRTHHLETETVG